MVKVDAAGRMLTDDSAKDDTAQSAAPSGNPSTRTRWCIRQCGATPVASVDGGKEASPRPQSNVWKCRHSC